MQVITKQNTARLKKWPRMPAFCASFNRYYEDP